LIPAAQRETKIPLDPGKGKITEEVGKLADLVILSGDRLVTDPMKTREIQKLETVK
jgi:predicted amidohydrolase YtcJ